MHILKNSVVATAGNNRLPKAAVSIFLNSDAIILIIVGTAFTIRIFVATCNRCDDCWRVLLFVPF